MYFKCHIFIFHIERLETNVFILVIYLSNSPVVKYSPSWQNLNTQTNKEIKNFEPPKIVWAPIAGKSQSTGNIPFINRPQ